MKPSFPGLSVACHPLNLSIFHSQERRGGGGKGVKSPGPKGHFPGGRPARSERGLAELVLGSRPRFSHKQREAKKWSLWITFFLFNCSSRGDPWLNLHFNNSWERAGGLYRAPCCMLIQICL